MNKRFIKEISILNQLDQDITIKELAKLFEVSERTIRNDLKEINTCLQNNHLPEMKIGNGGKIIREKDFADLMPLIAGDMDFYSYKLSKKERVYIAAVFLVSANGYITLSEVADRLYVSRATIINDLEDIKSLVQDHRLVVRSRANKGLLIEGDESKKRAFLVDFLESKKIQAEILKNIDPLSSEERDIVSRIVKEQEGNHNNHLTDYFYKRLINYLCVMIKRNREGQYIEFQSGESSQWYMMAQDILKYITQYCEVHTRSDEIRYLSRFLARCRYIRDETNNVDIIRIQSLTRSLIDNLSDELGIDFNSDYNFFESLSNHLQSVFLPEIPDYPQNNIIDEIVNEHPDILDAAKKCLPVVTQYMSRPIEQIEIAYIVVYICAALERKKNRQTVLRVIVACHAGIGTSHLLLARIKNYFSFQIVDVISAHEADALAATSADFVISTVPLPNCLLDSVVVSPLFTDEDYIKVSKKIGSLQSDENKSNDGEDDIEVSRYNELIEKTTKIVEHYAPNVADQIMRDFRSAIWKLFKQIDSGTEDIFVPSLHHLLPVDHIQLDVECTDWQDAIRKAAQLLIDEGYIESRYVDSMIENTLENGPYYVLSKGFAVPHEGIDKGSIKVGMNLIRLKEPINFGADEFDPIEFVCVLSAVDKNTHLQAFFNLVNMLQTSDFKNKLHNCQTSLEAASIIEQFEYQL